MGTGTPNNMIVRYLLIAANAIVALWSVAPVVIEGYWGDAVGAVVPIMTIAAILVTGSNAFRIPVPIFRIDVTIFRILVIGLNVLAAGFGLVWAIISGLFTDSVILSIVYGAFAVVLPILNVIYLGWIVMEAKKKNEGNRPDIGPNIL